MRSMTIQCTLSITMLMAGAADASTDPCEQGIFDPSVLYEVGGAPEDIATGDLNGDGFRDLVTSNRVAGTLTLLLSTGIAREYQSSTLFSGTGCQGVCVADFNSDGILDIAAAHRNGDDVAVRMGLGNGNFVSPVFYTAGNNPQQVHPVDLDQDGIIDLVTVNSFSDDVTVLSGMGDGTFAPPQSFPAGNSPVSVSFGDLDGDSDIDLVVANRLDDQATILLRSQDGSYSISGTLSSDDQPAAVSIGDINDDGFNDVLIGCSVGYNLSVYSGDGAGEFSLLEQIRSGNADDIVLQDMNGDGRTDIVSASAFHGDVAITPSTPTGFGPTSIYVTRDDVQSLVVSDLDNDGLLDIACASVLSSSVELVYATDLNTYGAIRVAETGQTGEIESLSASDLDGDGQTDLVYAVSGNPSKIHLRRGTGDGFFDAWLSLDTLLAGSATVKAGDMNNDGHPDLIVCSRVSPAVAVILSDGAGGFDPAIATDITPSASAADMEIGDFNSDGNLDVVLANANSSSVITLLGTGDGQFSSLLNSNATTITNSIDIEDINQDGLLDIAVGSVGTGEVNIAYGLGDGRFNRLFSYEPSSRVYDVLIADIDRDGSQDIITSNAISDTVSITQGPLSGASGFTVSYPFIGASKLAIADFNGDEWPDIAVTNDNQANVRILLSDGIGGFVHVGMNRTVGSTGSDLITVERNDGVGFDLVMGGMRVGGIFALLRNQCMAPTPCPADLNNDQVVNFFDVARFLALYNEQSALVDYNGDGMINFFDVAGFLLVFNQGCP